MESPASTVRRRAWINSSRQWLTLEDLDLEGPRCSLASASIADDDVFSDGCVTGKIENWLLACGSEACSENSARLSFESVLKANHFDDELGLGADVASHVSQYYCSSSKKEEEVLASVLNGGEITSGVGLALHPSSQQGHSGPTCSTPRQALCLPSMNLGHSMASSCLSSSTCKTTSSVSEVLQLCSEDAEETLYELGFGCDEPQVTIRIPPRFFTFPSLAQGINFRLFLDSQLRRIREEDPSLSLASRFRQVQVLTAMANAFYSLYSHVSRTPLQKLAAPEFSFSSSPVERMERFRSSVRSEPRSPVERLKDTVSKMCLYTGSPRGSDSTSPQHSPKKRSSLPDVVDIVLEKVKTVVTKKLDLGEYDRKSSAVDVKLVRDGDSVEEEQTQQMVVGTDSLKSGIKTADPDCSLRTSLASSSSGETATETHHQPFLCHPETDSTHLDTRTDNRNRVAKVTYDLICHQIVESVHQAPFCTHPAKALSSDCSETEHIDRSCSRPHTQAAVSEFDKHSQLGASTSLPVLASDGRLTQCCITVSGWEGGDVSSFSHTSTMSPVQTCEESCDKEKCRYLNPLMHQGLGHVSTNLQQVNSFELEEVHSAGEEDFRQAERTRTTTVPLSQPKGEVARGDSLQSDSSGYAEEEFSPSSNR